VQTRPPNGETRKRYIAGDVPKGARESGTGNDFAQSSFRAGQKLPRPLRRPLQATGAVLLRLGGRLGDLWLRAHEAELLSSGVPPHGLVPASGVRSKPFEHRLHGFRL